MAKFELKFLDFFGFHYIKCEHKTKVWYLENEEIIEITISDYNGNEIFINLDKSTAIKFAKTLRTEINKITEQEGGNTNG